MNAPFRNPSIPLSDAGAAENQAALSAMLVSLRARLEGGEKLEDPRRAVPAIARLAHLFALSRFEAEVLLLCAAQELDGRMPALFADAQGEASRPYPSFGLALALGTDPHWSALTPTSPLRACQLLDLDARPGLTSGRLTIAESVLHHIAGVGSLDPQARAILRAVATPDFMAPAHRSIAARIVAGWEDPASIRPVELSGPDQGALRDIAAAAAARMGRTLLAATFADLPQRGDARFGMLRRELLLNDAVLLLEGADPDFRLRDLADRFDSCFIIVAGAAPYTGWGERPPHSLPVPRLPHEEDRGLWREALAGTALSDIALDAARLQFRLPVDAVRAVGRRVADGGENTLWHACRTEAAARLDHLAQRVEAAATWDDLVLPSAQTEQLRSLLAQLRARHVVHEAWGFAARGERGLGITALFAGASGTGKTMAAEVLAGALDLDLFRIDLSQVVSKYIGETEKNLAEVFAAADAGGAVLLFDEADALFGKRSEVKDSHDRYANLEISFLLQRMESYRGLAILTTNHDQALDGAFLRRLRAIVQFPFPDAAQRAELWRRAFPAAAPTEGLAIDKLARLSLSGGSIRNIALAAAFLAADAAVPIRMSHLRSAVQAEYAKLSRPLNAAEMGDW